MYAITLNGFGDPEVMEWARVDDLPPPGPGQVAIDVVAAGVNRADVMQRMGFYPPPPGASETPGLEVSGVIADVGAEVQGWAPGDAVCALLAGGGYADRVNVAATQVLPVPQGVSVTAAAALPEAAATVWSNVVMTGGLDRGQTLLIHGGGSGIGTHAIQVGRGLGANVAVTAGTQFKLDRCRELGAQTLINYREQDFPAVVNAEYGGANVILDIMGGSYLAKNVQALAENGHLTIIGLQGGATAELDLGALLFKRGSVHVTNLRRRPEQGPGSKAEIITELRRQLWPLIAQGTVAPVVAAEVPITDAAEAHKLLDSAQTVGKVLLTVREP
ncbi:NAD(P)H-quinone oxidoreductase [Mycobacterium talmoniae]|uniref:NAD(P)H-quinone oxidoreductase n=1 Tax=Mycobacterium talmoniae TaxID=1858794 RepID=A0A1S1NPJ3_9MYCO|nr:MULTISPECIES: NAD(P)H-quinone oxidoreductase [Mycobacterium]OHV05265.1 NAD(P)H-quinone oxidoreductase [Mycobacterium talmoniae]PQM46815.1 Quinone oxidoreductase 1 [Mycobacterium talmoniae]TDH52296.1 NAD(P)H-quinone oxidoreductase [Mycobacterium eburneum]